MLDYSSYRFKTRSTRRREKKVLARKDPKVSRSIRGYSCTVFALMGSNPTGCNVIPFGISGYFYSNYIASTISSKSPSNYASLFFNTRRFARFSVLIQLHIILVKINPLSNLVRYEIGQGILCISSHIQSIIKDLLATITRRADHSAMLLWQ